MHRHGGGYLPDPSALCRHSGGEEEVSYPHAARLDSCCKECHYQIPPQHITILQHRCLASEIERCVFPEQSSVAFARLCLAFKECSPAYDGRKQAKRLKINQSSPYDQYIPPDDQLPAGFTSFPTLFPSPTSVLGPPAFTPYCAQLQPQAGPQQAAAFVDGAHCALLISS